MEALVDEEYGEGEEEEEEVSTSDEDANRTDDDDEWEEGDEGGETVMVEGVIHDPIHVSATPPSAMEEKEEKEEKESYDDLKDRMVRRTCVCV